jgi:HK97 family phage portal protein
VPLWTRRRDLVRGTAEVVQYIAENRGVGLTVSNPAVARYLNAFAANYSGEHVTEDSAMGLSAVWRGGALISQTIGTIPLKTYRTLPDGERERVTSFLDDPSGPESDGDPYLTPFEWKETVCLHLYYQGETFLWHRRNVAGALIGLTPIHPLAVVVNPSDTAPGGKTFDVALKDGEWIRDLEGGTGPDSQITHITGPKTRGLRGVSFLSVGRNSVGMTLAAERSAAEQFANGPSLNGAFTPRAEADLLSEDDINELQADLDRRLNSRGTSKFPIINRILEFQPWSMTNADAQWLESRAFQIEEICRWTGIPPVHMMQLEKQTSWGTGVAEQSTNLARQVLKPYTSRIEERVSRLLATPRFAEFDFAGLMAGSPKEETDLLLTEVNGGLRTLNEARRIKNLPPLPGGDALRIPSGVMLQAQLEASAAKTEAEVDATAAPTPEGTVDGA